MGDDNRGRPQGELVEVLKRCIQEITGQFVSERGVGIVIPDNVKLAHRILIPKNESLDAKHGSMVVAEILNYPSKLEQATGRITKIIGTSGDKGLSTEIAIHSHGIPFKWPDNVKKEVQNNNQDIEIGSYPFFHAGKLGVSIVLRSENKSKIDSCNLQILNFIKEKKIEVVDR